MAVDKARRALVQKLRRLASRYATLVVSDTAGRKQVEAMHLALMGNNTLSTADRKEAEDTYRAYCDSLVSSKVGSNGKSRAREWKFHAAQLTYNSTVGDWASKDKVVLKGLFDRFLLFAQQLIPKFDVAGVSATLEESLETGEHVHAHLYMNMTREFRGSGRLAEFAFEGAQPHIETNKAGGKAYSGAVRHGHFYVYVDKKGSLFSWSNFMPFKHYRVESWWLDNLLKHDKIDRDVYLSYCARAAVGFKRRLEDVRAVEGYEKERAVIEHVAVEAEAARKMLKAVKDYPQIEAFIQLFKDAKLRRPILAIIGGTNLGKSVLGNDVLKRICKVLGLPDYLEITVETNEHLDFADFDVRIHGGVLLDGVGDALILKKNREALQGRAKLAKGAQSATMMYSYKYTLAKRAVVATFDLSAENLWSLQTDHWLSNPQNVIQLHLTETVIA